MTPEKPRLRIPAGPWSWKTRRNPIGVFHSAKSNRGIPFWDEYELTFARKAEGAQTVNCYESRPSGWAEWSATRYIPNFMLSTSIGLMAVEISEFGMPATAAEAERAELARDWFDEADVLFADFSRYEVMRRKLFARNRALRGQPNDDGALRRKQMLERFMAGYDVGRDRP